MGGVDVMRCAAIGLLLSLACAGCVGAVGAETEAEAEAIVGGMPSTDDAVVAILGRRPGCTDLAHVACSGVVIAPRVVLTAAHCVLGFDGPTSLEVFFGPDASGPGTFVVVAAGVLDPDYSMITGDHDLALLALASDAPVTPLALADASVETLAAGAPLRAVGFGTTGGMLDDVGVRRSGTMTLGAIRPGAFDAAPGPGLSCRGDSGGPVLASVGGVEQIIGITASGDAVCAERATQVRIDAARTGFIQPTLDTFATLGPAWPDTAIALDDVGTASCAEDADCPALMTCDTSAMRCGLPSLGPASLLASCTTDASCGGDVCARVWPDGADACRCAHLAVAPPPPDPGMGSGGCSVSRGGPRRAGWLLVGCLVVAMILGSRGRLFGAAGAVLAALVAFALWPRDPAPAPVAEAPPEAPLDFGPIPELDPHAPAGHADSPPTSGTPPPTTTLDLTGLTIAEQAALIGDDDLSDGLDLPAPPPRADTPPVERPAEFVPATADVIAQREAGLHLLDTSIERLRAEADDLDHEGDHEGAARARVRADRMTALRARREEELETLRSGGALPTPAEQLPRVGPEQPDPAPPPQP